MEETNGHALHQASLWRDRYRLPPRGHGHIEPGMLDPGGQEMLAYRIAKAAYQQRPDVLNLAWLSKETGLAPGDIEDRIRSLYERRLLMLVSAPAVQVYGLGLYYWFGKFHAGTLHGVREQVLQSSRENDSIWSGYAASGAFDSLQGACVATLDQLIQDVLPEIAGSRYEWIRLCPVARAVRSEHVNLWDAPAEKYRDCEWAAQEIEALSQRPAGLDKADIALFLALNRTRPMARYFDFRVLAELSGLDAAGLQNGIERAVEETRQLVPVWRLNWQKLGLTQTIFAVRLRRDLSVDVRSRLVDDLAANPEFHTIWQFSDAYYDLACIACTQTAGIPALRRRIEASAECDLVDEAEAHSQYRCWGCRQDDGSGMWEQSVAPGAGLVGTRA